MTLQAGVRYRRPAVPALTAYPLSARIVLPYLLAAFPDGAAYQSRWLYQFTVGQSFRLRPEQRARLLSAIQECFGSEARPRALLRRASADPIARRMLRDAEDHP
jgi:hypothetical protein